MPVHRKFDAELSLHDLRITDESTTSNEQRQRAFSETSSSCSSCLSESSFNRLDIEQIKPKGILKPARSNFSGGYHAAVDAWTEQPISDCRPFRGRRRRRSSASRSSYPSKYDRVKTRFYGIEDDSSRERPPAGSRKKIPRKTLEQEDWAKTCRRFLL